MVKYLMVVGEVDTDCVPFIIVEDEAEAESVCMQLIAIIQLKWQIAGAEHE